MKTRAFILVGLLAAATCAALAYSGRIPSAAIPPAPAAAAPPPADGALVAVSGRLVQDKIHSHGDGAFDLEITLTAAEVPAPPGLDEKPVDMVVVLDRSGSMSGAKIRDACEAVAGLAEQLSGGDRFALVTYSNDVQSPGRLLAMSDDNRRRMLDQVREVRANGGTNLGAGLQTGIRLLTDSAQAGRTGKVILISDGQANQGVVEPRQLAAMAAVRPDVEYSVTTVGVGQDFNEQLMAAVADGGRGRYHYLENPARFLAVFTEEAKLTRAVAASNLSLHIPLAHGMEVISASGYPVVREKGEAVVTPGTLLSGQPRTLYLTLRGPAEEGRDMVLKGLRASYIHDGQAGEAACPETFTVEVTDDALAALDSIDESVWTSKVIENDCNALREQVALDIKEGKKEEALKRIAVFQKDKEVLNSRVQSQEAAQGVGAACEEMRQAVEDTFTGDAPSVARKQQSNAKSMQYKGYLGSRGYK